ncbi:Endoglucanase E-4 [Mycobacterium attenuatum]|uniref:Endoglucanase E-4 n=2 Tax=Mycobacterium attenuatum TaxID=2341086 RepID=A0A498Q3J1_9MYCO|nr:Endoglucanase E-4 [Mycobacterium attenuatum]VBA54030.1 Endoglucanase E-4 [Mycobacterium attenuatum]VBA58620.1 Endoglucanase E-4 [Mycobacterium attenuatum]
MKISSRFRLSKVTAACWRWEGDIAFLVLVLASMAGLKNYVKRWRAALHVSVSALIVAILGLAITPAAHAAAATATLAVEHTWQTGFIARFTITNSSMVPLTDWKLEFDMPAGQSVLHTWNSTVTQSGTHYILTPANWNRAIAPGGSATGGFRGVLSGSYSPPSNCLFNGQYPCS